MTAPMHPFVRLLPVLAATALAGALPAQFGSPWQTVNARPVVDAAVFDVARGRLLLVDAGSTQHVWQWDGTGAHERQLELEGAPTILHLTYDHGGRQVVALARSGVAHVGTWAGAGWTWRTSANAPSLDTADLASTAVAFDHLRGRLVVFVGAASGSRLYEWDGQQWWLAADRVGPWPRIGAAFAFDPDGRRCVLYGGRDATRLLGDAWAWDGFQWTQLEAAAPPGPRERAAFAFDHQQRRLVLYGGQSLSPSTWQLVGSTWSHVTSFDPGHAFGARLFPDDRGLLLLGPSRNGNTLLADPHLTLWRLQGAVWIAIDHLADPTPRTAGAIAYDPVRDEFVGFGGTAAGSFAFSDLTVRFAHGQWRHVDPPNIPAWRHSCGLCWSPPDQRVLLFGGAGQGGALGDTWTWTGSVWQQRTPATSPSPRSGFVMTPDATGNVLLFGGTDGTAYFADTWHWNGADWQPLQPPSSPSPRALAVGAFDPALRRVVMFGGIDPSGLQETWDWDGATWTRRSTTVEPAFVTTMAVRPDTGRLLLTGERAFEWTGTDWLPVPPGGFGQSPTVPRFHRLATDTRHGRLYAFEAPTVKLLTPTPPVVEALGAGCARGPDPAITAVDRPSIGAPFSFEVGTRAAAVPVLLVVGLGTQQLALGGGCTQHVAQPIGSVFALANGGGVASIPFALPDDVALRGLPLTVQGAVIDPGRGVLGPIALTRGLRVFVGD